MSGRLDESALAEWRAHWPVVLAAMFGVGLQTTYLYSMGIMISPIEKEYGWSRAEITMGPSIVSVIGFFAAPFMGMAIDRFGARRIAMIGVFSFCVALMLLSRASANIHSWWGLWFVAALVHPFVKPTVWTAAVSSLFTSGRGLALAVAFCGTALGSGGVPILLHHLIENYGWRMAYVGLGLTWLACTLPLIFFLFYSAVDKQRIRRLEQPDAVPPSVLTGLAPRQAFLSGAFIKLAIATAAISAATIATIVNLVPILSEAGFSRGDAAKIAGVMGLAGIVGKLSGGLMIDRFDASKVVGMATACPAITCALLIMFPGSLPAAIVAVSILGLALGVEFDGVAYLVSRHFGLRHFGLIYGTIAGTLALTSGVAPVLANLVYDITKSYALLLWTVIPVALLSGVLFATMGPYPVFATPAVEEGGGD